VGNADPRSKAIKRLTREELEALACRMRALDLISIHAAGSGHPGGTLSVMDLVAVLFHDEARWDPEDPGWEDRDRIFFSAGHKAPALYAALTCMGRCRTEEAVTLRKLGSPFQGHPHRHNIPGIEVSSGSLGQGLGIAVGCALAGRIARRDYRVYCIMGDGEQQEGSVWEAVMSASHHGLSRLCAIVDRNRLQIDGPVEEVMGLEPLADKYRAFNWNVITIDGHDIGRIREAFAAARVETSRPSVIIADTVKGRGVSFMENQAGWHGISTRSREELDTALREIACPDFPKERVDELLAVAGGMQAGISRATVAARPAFSADYWWNVASDMRVDMVPLRFGFGDCMARIGADPRIVALHADISASIKITDFEKDHPERKERVVSVGIAEQNMMSVAAGLALEGMIPVTGTYGVFAAGRPWDQIRTTICYDNLNVKIAGAHGGISVGQDGATHQALEEISLMSVLPNMNLVVPCDSVEADRLCEIAILGVSGPAYLRLAREATPVVTGSGTPLAFGIANIVRYRGRAPRFKDAFETFLSRDYTDEGEDISIIACGPIVCEAMRAAYILREESGIEARIVNMHTVKPLDASAVLRARDETGAILTAEEHQKGGFGNIVAAAACVGETPRAFAFDMIGVEDRFGESGGPWELMVKFGLTGEHIAKRAEVLVRGKRGGRR
jgi:transketolase